MNIKKYRPIVEIGGLSALAFITHSLFLTFFGSNKTVNFHYSLSELYGFFFCCSLVIVLVLIQMKQKNIDSVGNTFMLLTCIKLVLAYILLHPILNSYHKDLAAEKTNFFLVFAIFLTLETIGTIRMLNKS